jgi:undecaprenyl-diphosphatase
MIAFVVTALPSFLLKKQIGANLESLWVMATAIFIGGIVMWIVDAVFTNARTMRMEHMTIGQAIWIGAAQITSALFPGTSRSMSTIAAGQLAGMTRPAALEFSFFLSMPTMAVATMYDLYKAVKPKHDVDAADNLAPIVMTHHNWVVLAIGFIVSFIVALAVVAWFMHWVRRRGFTPFAIYRLLLGAAMFGFLLLHRH